MRASVYVEYIDGTQEFHDLANDPNELQNSFSSLSPADKASLHAAVTAVQGCHDAQSCWQATRPAPVTAQR